jgi:cytochrome c peroxidase
MIRLVTIWTLAALLIAGCCDDPTVDPGDLSHIPYSPSTYQIQPPVGFPLLEIPADNPMTFEGVMLGRMLFFDPILSLDSTMSCSSCHQQQGSFTDNLRVSTGVEGLEGSRSSMSLLDVAFHHNGMFWDGRAATLEEQALMPVEDHLELNESWENVEAKLRAHTSYPEAFRKAFGITSKQEITRFQVARALAQFERTLVSSGNAKFDRYMRGEIFFTDSEFNGMDMFFDRNNAIVDAECAHCHAPPLFTTTAYLNNGIEPNISGLDDYPDKGRGAQTGVVSENGLFKVPTLRNIEFTAPYMHDGRFTTLEEVIEHYSSGGHFQPNKDALIYGLHLTPAEKQDILAFLRTLSDTTFLNNPDFSNPF